MIKHNKKNIIVDGIEYFSGTQKTSLKKINKEIDHLCEFIKNVEEEFNIHLNEIEYGPGFSVQYFQNEEFDEENYCLIAARSGKTYTLSDPVRVRVTKVDVERKLIDFVLVDE